jgi:hypothetical protein
MALAALVLLAGCGTTKSRSATEQLLMSDAVDRTIANIEFDELAGQKVYFDATYIQSVKGIGFVNADYVVSAIRQQMVSYGCLLQDKPEEADFVVEGRVGALGNDGHEIVYGVPASTGVTDAASLLPNTPTIPMIPEISIAKKQDYLGATKIALFAYHRETREPVWQSGVAVKTSNAKDVWFFGAGPFTEGTIYEGPRFAGMRLPRFFRKAKEESETESLAYYDERAFPNSFLEGKGPPEEWAQEIEMLAEMPELLPYTELPTRERPRRLPSGTRVADKPAAPAEQEAGSPDKSPAADEGDESPGTPAPAAGQPTADAAPAPDEASSADSQTIVR